MWPLQMIGTDFLLKTYGNYPSLAEVEVPRLKFDWNGPTLEIDIFTRTLPYNPPSKWGQFNAVHMRFRLLDVDKITLTAFGRTGLCGINFVPERARTTLAIEGATECSCEFDVLQLVEMSGYMRDGG